MTDYQAPKKKKLAHMKLLGAGFREQRIGLLWAGQRTFSYVEGKCRPEGTSQRNRNGRARLAEDGTNRLLQGPVL